jgi:hypothetical protein
LRASSRDTRYGAVVLKSTRALTPESVARLPRTPFIPRIVTALRGFVPHFIATKTSRIEKASRWSPRLVALSARRVNDRVVRKLLLSFAQAAQTRIRRHTQG